MQNMVWAKPEQRFALLQAAGENGHVLDKSHMIWIF